MIKSLSFALSSGKTYFFETFEKSISAPGLANDITWRRHADFAVSFSTGRIQGKDASEGADGRHAPHAAAKGGLRVSVFDPRAARPSQSCAAQGVGVREMRAVSAEEGRYGCIQKDDGE